jgi:hypothetical protein
VPTPITPKNVLYSKGINKYMEKIMATNRGWGKKFKTIKTTERIKFLKIYTYKSCQCVFHTILAEDLIDSIGFVENIMMCKST